MIALPSVFSSSLRILIAVSAVAEPLRFEYIFDSDALPVLPYGVPKFEVVYGIWNVFSGA